MKSLIRLFFKTLRLALTPFVLVWYRLTRPAALTRSPTAQQAVDTRTASLALYHYPTCPFCLKTRREIHRLGLNIELRDAQHDATH
ncbi:MAG: glutaredoxin domain-containing protein, partial [Thiobacillus sp.]